jgi:hypothetical protein
VFFQNDGTGRCTIKFRAALVLLRLSTGIRRQPHVPVRNCEGETRSATERDRGRRKGIARSGTTRHDLLYAFSNALFRRSISRQINGVKISCMASSILPPGTTMVFARDMNESWIMLRRY